MIFGILKNDESNNENQINKNVNDRFMITLTNNDYKKHSKQLLLLPPFSLFPSYLLNFIVCK